MPPGVRGLQRKDIADPPRVQTQPESVVFSVETIRNDRTEWDARRHRLLHQRQRNLRFGPEGRVALAPCEPVGRGVGCHVERIVDPFIRPERADRDDAIVDLADAAEVLPPDVCRLRAVLAIPRLIDHQRTVGVRSRRGQGRQRGEAAGIDGVRIPRRFGEKPLQALSGSGLCADNWLGVREGGQGLIALGGQEQPREIITEGLSLATLSKEGIEVSGEGFERAGGRFDRQARRHGKHLLP